jgi:hypothetical protein
MDVRELLQQLGIKVPDPTAEGEVSIPCFCGNHEGEGGADRHNSCSLNVFSGLWFCHVTGKGGEPNEMVQSITGKSKEEARQYLKFVGLRTWNPKDKGEVSTAPAEEKKIDWAICEVYERNLWNQPDVRSRAIKQFGWTDETMRRERIGFDNRTKRYTFPILSEKGELVNFRMYNPDAEGANKVISYSNNGEKGFGRRRLYAHEDLDKPSVFVVEGEKDRTLLKQVLLDNGVSDWGVVTGTGGAGTWDDRWDQLFEGKHVAVCYDRDTAGQENAQKRCQNLVPHATSVKNLVLDLDPKVGNDVTDYFVKAGKAWDDLKQLYDATDPYTSQTKKVRPVGVKDTTLYKPHLSEASQDRFLFKDLELRVMVAGKDLAPYAVPKKLVFECYMNQGNLCASCSNFAQQGVQEVVIDRDDPDLIKMVKQSEDKQKKYARDRFGVNGRCRAVDVDVEDYHNVEEVTLIPEIDFSAETDREYVSRLAYAMEHGIRPNKSYIVNGTSVPHPQTSHVVHFLHTIRNAQDSVDDFVVTPEIMERLKVFQADEGAVDEKFDEIARDLTYNITRIYGREDIIKAVDLCYHSVIAFKMQDKAVAKAWGDVAIVGDTRTGKTETVQAMIAHYRMGEMSLGENTSFAGLIGGLRQESGGRWILTWGRIPLNDRRLLAIDETSGLSQDIIGQMSGIRSNGVAEMMKVTGMQRTLARTRLIWISNPRSSRGMSDYSHGVEVLRELIGRPEDIARFDFIVSAATNEVPTDVINAASHEFVEHRFTSELCKLLIIWAWSRKSEHITFGDGAVELLLKLATEQSERYSSEGGIPLVEAGNHRIKLAKLAVAAACRTFSTEDGTHVIVRPDHVQFAADFLDECYQKPSLDYSGFSQALLARTHVSTSYQDAARNWIKQHVEWADLWRIHPQLRIDDFKNIFDLESKDVKQDIIKPLSRLRMVEKTPQSNFRKTPAFIALLREARNEGLFSTNGNGVVDPTLDPNAAAALDEDIPF